MSEKFKLTNEEITEVILHSPYSLADSPASLGQRATQIKKYFYNYIYTLAKKINLHLGEIENAIEYCNDLISDLEIREAELGSYIGAQVLAHNDAETSHPDIREKILKTIATHNQGVASHMDIREKMRELEALSETSYALASGRSQVYTFDDVAEMLEHIDANEKISLGDVFLIADPHSPDFTVFGVGEQMREQDIELSYSLVSSGEIVPVAQKSYFVGGIRLISTEGNLETSCLAKKDELDRIEDELYAYIEKNDNALDMYERELANKEPSLVKQQSSEEIVPIFKGNEYNLGLRNELVLSVEHENGFEAIVNFRSGADATTLDAPASLIFQGDDCVDGVLYPISNRIYEISIKEVLGVLIAKVGACDYEVIE